MPELPEVEALRDFLVGSLVGHEVVRVLPVAISVLKTYEPPVTAFEGREITGVLRYGKFLGIEADGGELHLVTHLARAGWLHWRDRLPDGPPRPGGKSPLALRVALDTGEGFDLTEAGTQKRLAVYVVRDPAEVPGVARLGPDPLADEFDVTRFAGLLAGERRQIKGALRDQSLIAGIGNAYSDEILHAARMSPFKLASSLKPEETRHLHEALRATLTEAVERSRGLAAGRLKAEKKSGLRVHGRTGEPCPVCGDTVREVSFSDSSLQYCPTCQTGGRPLADRRLSRLLK
ncbi:Fpg/Nei family DNA glycosylase [Streptomyces europaeiscabiei]|uniref:Fpg/Nei family DNA glycosylase n=1 Tax=Streptomyces europaeiscabiei TaxID=146819 RepID=A0ABU4NU32_9ACTN|nr:DNA-formamidopyrimidine glycosylase family protein [Streptomyces europaeiscabiei]MDX2764188.1 Fpg/Nei family DNA glycosylase [Streptomyces europaeiscabiei]MDX3547405.1 Fpg/Nei family DNA glycosylase [Streptomyces europaeiscabiei]MDX3557841.1 Fpg/Nei family DNA glycosylase [Streptomyces europaeiscabiei]MDX3666896.1 Fpg/Nei family DNA glycosylase [Streptomyces europaeiscabiei]MDX3705702.1 Fpg/Nei family DNA glycosylase [Streptomyces europaeiscabiei]